MVADVILTHKLLGDFHCLFFIFVYNWKGLRYSYVTDNLKKNT